MPVGLNDGPTTPEHAPAPVQPATVDIPQVRTRRPPAGAAAEIAKLGKPAIKTKSAPFVSPVADFYLSNPIARASATMAECAQMAAGLRQAAE